VFSVSASQEDGKDVWLSSIGRYIVLKGIQVFSRVKADRNTLRPMSSLFRHPLLGHFDATYTSDEVTIKTVNRDDGKQSTRKAELNGIYYDNEQSALLFRRLPLAKDFKATIPIFATFAAGAMEIEVEVTALETIDVPVGKFECYRLLLPKLQQTYWISTDEHRYPVKFEADGMFGVLETIRVNTPGEMVTYRDDKLGFSMAAPSEWHFVKKKDQDVQAPKPDKPEVYQLFDPEAEAQSMMRGRPAEILRQHDVDARGLAEMRVKKRTTILQDFKVRSDSWTERTISGHPGISFISDHIDRDKQMVQYYVCSLGESTAVEFFTFIEREKFDNFKPAFDAIIDTYREKSE
jgi:hypothetical protein